MQTSHQMEGIDSRCTEHRVVLALHRWRSFFFRNGLAGSFQSIVPIGRLDCSIAFVAIQDRDSLANTSHQRTRVDAARRR